MAIGVITGGSIQALFQLPFVLKEGWHLKFTSIKTAFTNPGTRTVLKLIGPTIIGMACYQLNDVVSTALAGRAGTGIVSSLQYSLRLQELILGIFAVTIGTVILPDLSGLAAEKKWDDFTSMLVRAIQIIALITIPVTVFSLIYGENMITLIYKAKEFSSDSVDLTMKAFTFHIGGLFFIALNRIVAPAFYAQGNTKSPTLAGIIGFAVNIMLALMLTKKFAGGGIAFALSAASLANTIALFFFMKNNKDINVKKIAKGTILYAVKMLLLALIAGVPVYFLQALLNRTFAGYNRFISNGLPLFLGAVLFFICGVLLLFITKDPIAKIIIDKVKARFARH